MKLQKLLSLTRQAVENYQLIEEGDKIAVGISGGKDSLVLLLALSNLKKFYPKKFELYGITVDLGYGSFDTSKISKLCQSLDVPYHVVKTEISTIVKTESKPCSLCAKLRKGALNQKALELGCNKVAFAHHADDLIETMLLSLLYEGRFHSCSPVTYWSHTKLTLIRPLIYLKEADIIGFVNKNPLPILVNPCPYEGHTRRTYVKDMLQQLNKDIPGCKNRLFHAILNGNFEDWPSLQMEKKLPKI
ncbi:MAG: tRNA 2-thiocytidine(32) synthetase TtcA [Clostridiales bacterium]|nr:tRNA 2-thiocytidine(32) synthetase TtcA [Clostridiales bacterium]